MYARNYQTTPNNSEKYVRNFVETSVILKPHIFSILVTMLSSKISVRGILSRLKMSFDNGVPPPLKQDTLIYVFKLAVNQIFFC